MKQTRFPLLTVPAETGDFVYADVLLHILRFPAGGSDPGASLSIDDIASLLHVTAEIKAAVTRGADYVLLDRTGAQTVMNWVRRSRWQQAAPEILAFCEAMLAAPEVEVDLIAKV